MKLNKNDKIYNIKKFRQINFKLFLVLIIILVGFFSLFFISNTKVFAQANQLPTTGDSGTGLVPCDGSAEYPCGFYQILDLINKVINFILVGLVIPIAAIMFAYAGFELLTSGGETSKREKAKTIFFNVAIGLIVAVAAFLIVQTVLSIVGYDKSWDWFGF